MSWHAYASVLHSFLQLSNIPVNGYTMFGLFIDELMALGLFPPLGCCAQLFALLLNPWEVRNWTRQHHSATQPPSQCQDLKYLWNKWKFRMPCLSRRDRAKLVGCMCNLCKINCFQHCSHRARREAMITVHTKSETRWLGFKSRLCHLLTQKSYLNLHILSFPLCKLDTLKLPTSQGYCEDEMS